MASLARLRVPNLLSGGRYLASPRLYQTTSTSQPPPDKSPADDKTSGAPSGELPARADVVVVGGGVIGCSTLYHLAKLGARNVVLLEKDKLTSGTTWHTGGLVWSLRPSDTEIYLLGKSRELMANLESETGVNTGWIQNGGLFLAKTDIRLEEYKRMHTLGKAFGVESFVLDPDETKKLYPLMNVSDLVGSLYSPQDGGIDAASYCASLSRGAERRGAKVIEDCAVTGVETYTDDFGTRRVKAVNTSRGTIQTDIVVNAAGVWGPNIGALADVKVPLTTLKHAYVNTERIDGVRSMPNARDHDASTYFKVQGDYLSVGGYEPNPIFVDKMQNDFAFSLYDLDWDVFGFNIEGAVGRIPAIETSGVKSTVCGPESFTPDHRPLLGEAPELRGFHLACGFNSSGMMHSVFGEQIAHWVLNGRPEIHMYNYDIRRFASKMTNDRKWCDDRSHEAYSKNYAIVFPHDQPLAGRNIRKDALYQELLEAGCVYEEKQGWERPSWYSGDIPAPVLPYDYYGYYGNEVNVNNHYYDRLKCDYSFGFPANHDRIGNECLTCRNSVAVFNMSYFGKYYLVGPDAEKAADWIFSNDMQKPIGSTVYTCILNGKGGAELDLTVSVIESGTGEAHSPSFGDDKGYYLAVGGGAAQHGYSYVQDIIQDKNWDCRLLDHSEDLCLISIQGPQSRSVLQSICDEDLSEESFPFGTNKIVQVAGREMRALRVSFVGELGWELHVPNDAAVATHRALMDAGKSHGIVNGGYRALDSLSLEKGFRLWHADLRSDDTPMQSLLGFTCKLGKDTSFLGRDALIDAKKSGLKKRLVFLTLDDHVPLFGQEVIWRDDKVVGFLRRGEHAYSLDKPMGCGYVSNTDPDGTPATVTQDWIRSGQYAIEAFGKKYPATVHLRSPFDPEHKRMRGVYEEHSS